MAARRSSRRKRAKRTGAKKKAGAKRKRARKPAGRRTHAAKKKAARKRVARKNVARKTAARRAVLPRAATPRVVPVPPIAPAPRSTADRARQILAHPNVTLATTHSSGRVDAANARQNLLDTAAGGAAQRSAYGNAPGGTVALHAHLLDGILTLAGRHAFRISELAGGSHSPTSRHYVGVALDVDLLDGLPVRATNLAVSGFLAELRALGATEVLGPGNPGHDTHIHGAWPRP